MPKSFIAGAITLFTLLLTGAMLGAILADEGLWPRQPRNAIEATGVADTGAINLVSAIYLGYRAYDTLGETIVLLLSVSGTIALLATLGKEKVPNVTRSATASKRTVLLHVAAGKLGPIVLMFGLYVMLFGHLSPGGGFQGGVVVASGVVFLAIGSRDAALSVLTSSQFLHRLESLGFFLLLMVSFLGAIWGSGFFSNMAPIWGMPNTAFVIALNVLIGVKVGGGIGLLCVSLLLKETS